MGEILEEQLATPVGIRLPADHTAQRGPLVEAYRAGDPLRVIAVGHGADVETICSRLASELNSDDDELARMLSIRARTSATKSDLQEQEGLVWRLARSGFAVADIPKVLSALRPRAGIDLDIMAELLQHPGPQNPDICADMPAPEEPSLSDNLSLLYVAGKHHGIEPDYQLALGQMPSEEVVNCDSFVSPPFLHDASLRSWQSLRPPSWPSERGLSDPCP